eukprot:TRINITY_DN14089_c0_g2_i2.p4 TRINITY_DN14089_c0_g2~~TRINITY_DN14089_c0_g2_i2.p4  ORF type:complete len:104 (-),score=0.83 TRINITY_DN14089_c0_g2_i2:84-395(-)
MILWLKCCGKIIYKSNQRFYLFAGVAQYPTRVFFDRLKNVEDNLNTGKILCQKNYLQFTLISVNLQQDMKFQSFQFQPGLILAFAQPARQNLANFYYREFHIL